ncbi:hypothetical protein [Streptomyces ipomoeae]|uniref:hypothetical protein n=1 Tax=Streptomyces ipomoeae TaxID=103232 RepID=UPI001146428A|nr:hypothetical protein [Streptomyces ipomoeae]MDX2932791.1 hypothetical protein [Streptomyces ipomoeae]TQE22845.1 hypothetical protein SipoB123_21985 [Streptomyces ipomoeae]
MSDTSEAGPRRAGVPRVVFRVVMAALIVCLAVRTYEETAVAVARSIGSLHTEAATVTELDGHTEHGSSGGGQDGGGTAYSYTLYTIELRLDDGVKTLNGVTSDSVDELWDGRQVTVGLWHGRIVEIDGRQVWPGWNRSGWDLALIALYPLITGYLISLVVSGCVYLMGRNGRVRLRPDEPVGATFPGILTALAATIALLALGAAGAAPSCWPLIPFGAGLAVALTRLGTIVRRAERAARTAASEAAPSKA